MWYAHTVANASLSAGAFSQERPHKILTDKTFVNMNSQSKIMKHAKKP